MGKKFIIRGADFSNVKVNVPILYYRGLYNHNNEPGVPLNLSSAGFGLNATFCESIVGKPINFIDLIPLGNGGDTLKIFIANGNFTDLTLAATIVISDVDLNVKKRYYFNDIVLNEGERLAFGDSSSMVDFGFYRINEYVPDGIISYRYVGSNPEPYGSARVGIPAPLNIGYYQE